MAAAVWAVSERRGRCAFYCPARLPYDLFQELVGSYPTTGIRVDDEDAG